MTFTAIRGILGTSNTTTWHTLNEMVLDGSITITRGKHNSQIYRLRDGLATKEKTTETAEERTHEK
jgi:hypothetical protein